MDLNKLTQKSQEALSEAQALAVRLGHQQVGAEHLLAALASQEQGLAPRLLEHAGYDPKAFVAALEIELSRLPSVSGPGAAPGQINREVDETSCRRAVAGREPFLRSAAYQAVWDLQRSQAPRAEDAAGVTRRAGVR